jgi:hypothetical protein
LLSKVEDIENIYINTIMPDKIRMNIDYFYDATLMKDLKFIVLTVLKII